MRKVWNYVNRPDCMNDRYIKLNKIAIMKYRHHIESFIIFLITPLTSTRSHTTLFTLSIMRFPYYRAWQESDVLSRICSAFRALNYDFAASNETFTKVCGKVI